MSVTTIRKLNALDNYMAIIGLKIALKFRKKPIDDKFVINHAHWKKYTTFDTLCAMLGKKRCECCNGFGFQDK